MWHTLPCVLHFEWDVWVITLTAFLNSLLLSPSLLQAVMHVANRVYFQPSCGHWADVCVILLLPGRQLKLGPQRANECLLVLFKNKYEPSLKSSAYALGSRTSLETLLLCKLWDVQHFDVSEFISYKMYAHPSELFIFLCMVLRWGPIFLISGFPAYSRHRFHSPASLKAPWEMLVQGRFSYNSCWSTSWVSRAAFCSVLPVGLQALHRNAFS